MMTELQQLMLGLDVALTGHDPGEVAAQIHHYPRTIQDWFAEGGANPTWHLSDSGYSRIVFSTSQGKMFLTSNSRDQVKARWDLARPQIAAAEDYIKAELAGYGFDFARVGEARIEQRWTRARMT